MACIIWGFIIPGIMQAMDISAGFAWNAASRGGFDIPCIEKRTCRTSRTWCITVSSLKWSLPRSVAHIIYLFAESMQIKKRRVWKHFPATVRKILKNLKRNGR
jgi:hypothetical protein